MSIAIIVATAENNAIGKDNQLIWHLPADLKHFKNLTSGHPILMGRKTYESIGRALPKRTNIIISRNKDLSIPNCLVFNSLEKGIEEALKINEDVFIIGGAELYKMALPLADKIYLTKVHQEFDADTFFPTIDTNEWQETAREKHEADEKNTIAYSFISLVRK